AIGGVVGYFLAYYFVIRKHGLSTWQLADIVAPSVAIGLCLGRIGCFLNGCCWGNVACPNCPQVHFYVCNPSFAQLVREGYQTDGGFTLTDRLDKDELTVDKVVLGSPASEEGHLMSGDVITKVNGHDVDSALAWRRYVFGDSWKRGETRLFLTVKRAGE